MKPKFNNYSEAREYLQHNDALLSKNKKNQNDATSFNDAIAHSLVTYFAILSRDSNVSKMEASKQSAISHFNISEEQQEQHDTYKAACIRKWGSMYMQTGLLPVWRQGCHLKTLSIITDNNIKIALRNELLSIHHSKRNPNYLQQLLNSEFLEETFNISSHFYSLETCRRWLHHLNFTPTENKKGYYTDGHERADVVEYRNRLYLPAMQENEKFMRIYTGEDMLTESLPKDINENEEVVMIYHDETTIYCGDSNKTSWIQIGTNVMIPKSKGQSIMVSGFICSCHGFMQLNLLKSYKLFRPGINNDGWWINQDLVNQVNECIPLFKELHQNKKIVLVFDNSMNHHKKPLDGLDANVIPKKDGGSNCPVMRNTTYNYNDKVYVQQLQHLNGVIKGAKNILEERGLFIPNMQLVCSDCKADIKHCDRNENNNKQTIEIRKSRQCCIRYCLQHENDFMNQKEWLSEVVIQSGFSIIYLPKFHCELNPIEMVWCKLKNDLRSENKVFKIDELETKIIQLLNNMNITFIRRIFRHVLRYMSGYRCGLIGNSLEYAMKEYHGHRVISLDQLNTIELEYNAKYKAANEFDIFKKIVVNSDPIPHEVIPDYIIRMNPILKEYNVITNPDINDKYYGIDYETINMKSNRKRALNTNDYYEYGNNSDE